MKKQKVTITIEFDPKVTITIEFDPSTYPWKELLKENIIYNVVEEVLEELDPPFNVVKIDIPEGVTSNIKNIKVKAIK